MRGVFIERWPDGLRRDGGIGFRLVVVAFWSLQALFLSGCATHWSYRAMIQSADVNERVRGAWAAGESRDQRAVPLLVDRLEDEDEAVRFVAILALEKITGERLGYDYARPVTERTEAVERWRAYVRARATGETPSSPAEQAPQEAGTAGGE